jgi:hypothetical protein
MILALWLGNPEMAVTGDSTCPTPAEVREQLAALEPGLVGDAAARPAVHQTNISGAGSGVHIELLSLDGRLVAERTLERTGSCGDVAEAVAVIISAWDAKFNPNLLTPVVEPPQALPDEPASVPSRRKDSKLPSSHPMPFDAGLALLASIAGGEATFGAKLEGCVFGSGGLLGLDVGLSATSTHTQSITTPAAAAQWTRAALSAGPTYRLRRNAIALDVHAGGALAVLHVQGTGLTSTSSDTSAQLGLTAGLRFIRAWNNAAGWVGTDVFTYPGQDRLSIGNYGEVGKLPRYPAQFRALVRVVCTTNAAR